MFNRFNCSWLELSPSSFTNAMAWSTKGNTITGLERFKIYSFRVTAHGTAGASPTSEVKLARGA